MWMRFLGTIAGVLLAGSIFGQAQLSLYPLNSTIPQAHQINPAFMPEYKVIVGLPVISSLQVSFDNDDISLRDILKKNENGDFEPIPDKDAFVSKLKNINDLDLQANVGLLFLGFRIQKNFFSVTLTERLETSFTYPRELASWGLQGPANSDFADVPLTGKDISVDGTGFHELAAGYSRYLLNDRLSVGLRAKYLRGYLNVSTEKVDALLFTSTDSIRVVADEIIVNTSGIEFFNTDDPASDLFLNNSSSGFAVDFGAQFKVTNKFTVSASVLDIGGIEWKDYNNSYRLSNASYDFNGFDLLDLIAQDTDSISDDLLSKEWNKIDSAFNPEEVPGEVYSTNLQPKFYVGGNYEIIPGHKVGALVYSALYKGSFQPALSVNYNFQARKIFNGVINASFIDGTVNNIGVGFSLNFGFFQFYSTTNAITSVFYPARASVLDLRLGINFVFGKIREQGVFRTGAGGRAEGDISAPQRAPSRANVNPTGTSKKIKHDPKKINKSKQKRIKKQYKKKKRKKYS